MGTKARARYWINDKGYVCVYVPGHPAATRRGYVLEHRLVMEHALGRPLERGETVRHKDGNHQNNDPDNLVVLPSGAASVARHEARATDLRETADVAEGAARLIRAVCRRVGRGDAEELELIRDLQEELAAGLEAAVRGLRAQGVSDSEIARVLGVSQQAVSKRWKREGEEHDGERARE